MITIIVPWIKKFRIGNNRIELFGWSLFGYTKDTFKILMQKIGLKPCSEASLEEKSFVFLNLPSRCEFVRDKEKQSKFGFSIILFGFGIKYNN